MNPPPATAAASAASSASSDHAWRELHRLACAPYRAAGRFAWHFARGKLGRDPVFRHLVEQGLIRGRRVVDIGCGQGLFASLLHHIAVMQGQGRWPAAWPATEPATAYTGIELMPRDVARAEHAVGGLPLAPRFVCGDMREAPLPACELVVILDVLHYVDHAAQQGVLERVHAALAPGGRLLLRVGDMDSHSGFRASQWVDRIVTGIRGHRAPPTWGRPLTEWKALLRSLGFEVESRPMSQGTPFANVLLIADRA